MVSIIEYKIGTNQETRTYENRTLSCTDAGLQREALCTLINLGQGTEKDCEKIYDAVGIYITLIISNTSNISQCDLGAWCIGNLCGRHQMICKRLQKNGTPQLLIQLLKSKEPHVSQSAAYAGIHYFTTLPEEMK
ncbi:hypothetical protein SK128_023594 [Halocaridina rubra]|uniref:Uncharacterized protein n=1 Tax=Halocaridina rubra TaxID=373956 RepID=A0AAN8X2Z5_HALRR